MVKAREHYALAVKHAPPGQGGLSLHRIRMLLTELRPGLSFRGF